jgi:DNA polymerase-3 subunit epsilon
MKICIFDTETTGLPIDRKIPGWQKKDNWPHIVSISWMILDGNTNKVIDTQSYIVYPHDWVIPPDSTKIHGITQEHAIAEGYDLSRVLHDFMKLDYDVLVAHNMEFDYNVILYALNWDIVGSSYTTLPFSSKELFCSMKFSKDLCKIKSSYYNGYKSPKLSELYTFVTGKQPNTTELHNSLYDVQLLTEVIQTSHEIRIKLGLLTKSTTNNNVGQKGDRILRI